MTSAYYPPSVLQATLRMNDRSFGPLDRCVFCCREFTDLRPPTDEHIVPDFAGGKVIIKDGSYRSCARHSNSFYESSFAQTTFQAYRFWVGSLKSNARGILPAAKGKVFFDDNESAFTIHLDQKMRPPIFTLIDLPPPRICFVDRGHSHGMIRAVIANFTENEHTGETSVGTRLDRRQRLQYVVRLYLHELNLTLQERHDMRGLYLSIAKIGYCFAVAFLGFEAFDHQPIRALLAGERTDVANFVGGYRGAEEDLPRDSLHLIHLRLSDGVWSAIVHLYATKHGIPYEVILGASS